MAYDLVAAVEHVVHDYSYLIVPVEDTQRPLDGPYNHYAERTFLVHCRSVAKFFSDEEKKTDLYARDFVVAMPKIDLSVWDCWSDHVDKHIMHLTQKRITNKVPWTGSDNKRMLKQFRIAWHDFYEALQPFLKPEVDKWLDAKQLQMPQVTLR
jgi:hypothetical protein